jgi:hypothetical protein
LSKRRRPTTADLLRLVATAQRRQLTPDEGLTLGKAIHTLSATCHSLTANRPPKEAS